MERSVLGVFKCLATELGGSCPETHRSPNFLLQTYTTTHHPRHKSKDHLHYKIGGTPTGCCWTLCFLHAER